MSILGILLSFSRIIFKNDNFTLFQAHTDDEDGKTSLEFSIEASEQKFTLHCPFNYPNYGSDDNFFVEADSDLQMWCNALNEYLLDTDGQLSLSAILDKGLSLYSAADARTRSREVSMSRDELIFRQNILNIFCKKQA